MAGKKPLLRGMSKDNFIILKKQFYFVEYLVLLQPMNELFGALKPLRLLEAVASAQHATTLAELASSMNVPKPTMHRWLGSLENAGLLQRTPDGRRYELAARASNLA